MTMKFMTAGIAMAALLAMAACDETTGGTGGAGGFGGTGGIGGFGGIGGGTGGIGGGTGGTGPSCFECACDYLLSEGGCKDKCDKDFNGNPNTPNFCNDVNALPQCAECIQDKCGSAPSQCF